jgi:hypothetical protein
MRHEWRVICVSDTKVWTRGLNPSPSYGQAVMAVQLSRELYSCQPLRLPLLYKRKTCFLDDVTLYVATLNPRSHPPLIHD